MNVPLAYKFVAVTLMLAEVNYCATKLRLPIELPITQRDLHKQAVFSPEAIVFAGRLDTERYSFSFVKSGRLRFITSLRDNRGSNSLKDYIEGLSRIKSNINEADAYRIATNWLAAMDVDLLRLEKEHGLGVAKQQFARSWPEPGQPEKEIPLPLFDVNWGKWSDSSEPVIDIEISGIDGELLKLRQENDLYSRRPARLIKDVDKLLAIPDSEFLKYTPEQRSNLVAEFAAVQYPPLSNQTNNGNRGATNSPTQEKPMLNPQK